MAVLALRPDRLVSQPDPGSLAAHFDSLASAESAKPHPDRARFERLSLIAFALGAGAEPGHVVMSIAGRPMSFEIVGVRRTEFRTVGWHDDAAADTTINIFVVPYINDRYVAEVTLFRGSAVDSGAAVHPAFNFNAVSDTTCMNQYYRLIRTLDADPRRCHLGHATMSFATLSPGGTLIASPAVVFGIVHVVLPSDRPVER